MKPNKTAREFEKMKLDPIRCYSWDEIWNWHISQLKDLEKEIKVEKLQNAPEPIKEAYNQAIDMALEVIKKYER